MTELREWIALCEAIAEGRTLEAIEMAHSLAPSRVRDQLLHPSTFIHLAKSHAEAKS